MRSSLAIKSEKYPNCCNRSSETHARTLHPSLTFLLDDHSSTQLLVAYFLPHRPRSLTQLDRRSRTWSQRNKTWEVPTERGRPGWNVEPSVTDLSAPASHCHGRPWQTVRKRSETLQNLNTKTKMTKNITASYVSGYCDCRGCREHSVNLALLGSRSSWLGHQALNLTIREDRILDF